MNKPIINLGTICITLFSALCIFQVFVSMQNKISIDIDEYAQTVTDYLYDSETNLYPINGLCEVQIKDLVSQLDENNISYYKRYRSTINPSCHETPVGTSAKQGQKLTEIDQPLVVTIGVSSMLLFSNLSYLFFLPILFYFHRRKSIFVNLIGILVITTNLYFFSDSNMHPYTNDQRISTESKSYEVRNWNIGLSEENKDNPSEWKFKNERILIKELREGTSDD